MLTNNEKMVLNKIISESNFNFDRLDLTKSWSEQRLEDPENFWAFADVRDYGCGLEKQACRGVFSSLVKKNLCSIFKDDDVTWLTIDEKQFNNIKKELAC